MIIFLPTFARDVPASPILTPYGHGADPQQRGPGVVTDQKAFRLPFLGEPKIPPWVKNYRPRARAHRRAPPPPPELTTTTTPANP